VAYCVVANPLISVQSWCRCTSLSLYKVNFCSILMLSLFLMFASMMNWHSHLNFASRVPWWIKRGQATDHVVSKLLCRLHNSFNLMTNKTPLMSQILMVQSAQNTRLNSLWEKPAIRKFIQVLFMYALIGLTCYTQFAVQFICRYFSTFIQVSGLCRCPQVSILTSIKLFLNIERVPI